MGKNKNKNTKTKQNYSGVEIKTLNTLNNFKVFKSEKEKKHEYKGTKNKTSFPEFVEICKYTQEELKENLPTMLVDNGYTDVVIGDGYIYAKGELPVLLTAHMDTVHKDTIKDFYEYIDENGNHILSSPQGIGGDDRCGIYMILQLIKEFKPTILFCEDEESGGIGSRKFCKTELIKELEDMRFLIELDRANANDAVFYECANKEFTQFIEKTTGYKKAWGSFSDISTLAPECGVAAVNLSCGYYHAHTLEEEVNVEEMLHTIEVVKKLLVAECEQFEYVEEVYSYGYGSYSKYSGYGYGYNRSSFRNNYSDWYDEEDEVLTCVWVTYFDKHICKEVTEEVCGKNKEDAMLSFFMENPTICWNDILDYEFDYVY